MITEAEVNKVDQTPQGLIHSTERVALIEPATAPPMLVHEMAGRVEQAPFVPQPAHMGPTHMGPPYVGPPYMGPPYMEPPYMEPTYMQPAHKELPPVPQPQVAAVEQPKPRRSFFGRTKSVSE